MNNSSIWSSKTPSPASYPLLNSSIEVDVAIIGGGITGVSAAYELVKRGKTVALIEAHKLGGLTTSLSTGNLYIPVQPLFQKIIKKFSLEEAKKVASSRAAAIDAIEKNTRELAIDCNFTRRPWYGYCSSSNQQDRLVKEIEALKCLDLAVDEVKDLPFDLKKHKAYKLENQARFNPLRYVLSLAEFLQKQGCLIFENTQALNLKEDKICTVTTKEGKITAKAVIMATHTPLGINSTHFYTAPYRSYVLALNLPDISLPDANIWKLEDPYFALSTHALKSSEVDTLLIAGKHHKTGQNAPMDAHFKGIMQFLEENFPDFREESRWSAQHYQSADTLPYIGPAGRFSKNIYMATGYFADGLVYGTVAAQHLAALIEQTLSPSPNLYSSTRFKPLASMKFLVEENSNVAKEYLKDLPITKTPDLETIKKGEGQILEINKEKIAISRDKNNKLHKVSAVCPHMKCIVAWNNAEQTWDCPCHGSRFSQSGEYLEGPALCGLKKIED